MTPHPIPLSVIDTAQEFSAAADRIPVMRADPTADILDTRWRKKSAEVLARKEQSK